MPDFEEMYYTLMRASEEALRIMIEAQKECEEMYIAQEESEQKKAVKRPPLNVFCRYVFMRASLLPRAFCHT